VLGPTSQCLVSILKSQKFDMDQFAYLTKRSIGYTSYPGSYIKYYESETMQVLCFSISRVHLEVSTGNTWIAVLSFEICSCHEEGVG